MLTVQEAAVVFFTHSSRAEGAIGFACRHFGEEAFGKRRRIKIPSFQDKNAKQKECNIIHQKKVARRIHIDAARRSMTGKCGTMTGEYSVKRDEETREDEGRIRERKKTHATTYFGCTAAPGDSCGAPALVVLPSDVSPASFDPPHSSDPGNAGRHRSLGRYRTGALGCWYCCSQTR